MEDAWPVKSGVLICGFAPLNKAGALQEGPDMPVANAPAWSAKTRTGEMGVIGRLNFAP